MATTVKATTRARRATRGAATSVFSSLPARPSLNPAPMRKGTMPPILAPVCREQPFASTPCFWQNPFLASRTRTWPQTTLFRPQRAPRLGGYNPLFKEEPATGRGVLMGRGHPVAYTPAQPLDCVSWSIHVTITANLDVRLRPA